MKSYMYIFFLVVHVLIIRNLLNTKKEIISLWMWSLYVLRRDSLNVSLLYTIAPICVGLAYIFMIAL